MAYLPIGEHGVIGNMQTAALVGRDGRIDWLCLPYFDSPSIFAAILDDKKGGHFLIAPVDPKVKVRQTYWPGTNVLITRFMHEAGVVEVTDYMPVSVKEGEQGFRQLVRRVEAIRGSVPMRMEFCPRFNYARDKHQTKLLDVGALFHSESLAVELNTPTPIQRMPDDAGVSCEFALKQGEKTSFVLRPMIEGHKGAQLVSPDVEQELLERTVAYWHDWLKQCSYTGRWREMVHRSALVLKMLCFEPTGAIVAAPTCSLPESIGAGLNWDYRYTWIRDASFSMYALLRLGFKEEARAFMGWIEQRCHEREPDGGLQVMYGLNGEHELPELTLDHLEGYRGSGPVRVGNAAAKQFQLDIYGELMDSVYIYNKYDSPISWEMWQELVGLVEWVCKNWKKPDAGIWETRGEKKQFVYSKVMCWVCLDRAIRLADKRSLPGDRPRWIAARDEIYQDVMKHGYHEGLRAFVQHYDADKLDAAVLVLPLVFFVAPDDPRALRTFDAVSKNPADGGLLSANLVYRNDPDKSSDGLKGCEGTFNVCTFWLAEGLARAGMYDPPKLDQARLLFEKMLSYANPLGLFSEEMGLDGQMLGNFPLALTHLGLISCAYHLNDALGPLTW